MDNQNNTLNLDIDRTHEIETLIYSCSNIGGLLRKLMSAKEIHLANKLVKQGVLYKGTSDDRQGSVCYFKQS